MAIFEKKFKIGVQIDGGQTRYKYVAPLEAGTYYAGYQKWDIGDNGESKILAQSVDIMETPADGASHTIQIYVGSEAGTFTWDATNVMMDGYFTNIPVITWTDYTHNMLNTPYGQSYCADPSVWDDYPYVKDWFYSSICPYGANNDHMRLCVLYYSDPNTNQSYFMLSAISRQINSFMPESQGGWFAYNDVFNNNPERVDIRQYNVSTIEYPDLDPDEPVNPDDTGGNGSGDGSSDAVDFPDGIDISNLISNARLFNVYHASLSNIQSLNSFLWSDNWIDNFKKNFSSPMECIAGLHILPLSLLGSSDTIKLGGLDTEISSERLTSFTKLVDCGSLDLSEYWGNFLDYENTTVKIYLPFVGFQLLETKKIMGARLHIKYRVDILSGDFQCFIKRTKDGNEHVLYTFSGNMAISLPLSQSNNSSIMNSVLGLTAGAITSAVTGSPMPVGMAISTVGLAMAQNASGIDSRTIIHNGSYGGNKGYLGEMTPYLIIERPTQQIPSNYNNFVGIPSYFRATLSSCSGFTKVQDVHLVCSGDDEDRNEIIALLKGGVII